MLGLDDELAIRLAADPAGADSWKTAPPDRRRRPPREIAAGMQQRAVRDHEGAVISIGSDLGADLLARDHERRNADRGEAFALLPEIAHVRCGEGQLEVADLAE
jgi:hypothetical protein